MLWIAEGLGFRVYGIGFRVCGSGLGFRVYNTLVNCFNKHLNKSDKVLFEML